MKTLSKIGFSLGVLTASVFSLSAHALFANWDNEICALFEGTSCGSGTEMFYMHMGSGNNSTNRQRCETLPAICRAPDIDRWVAIYQQSGSGGRGYRSGFTWGGVQVDKDGFLSSTSGKTYVRCFKNRRRGDWVAHTSLNCGGVPPTPCSNGKILNANNECVPPDGVLDTDNANSVHSFGVAQALHGLASQHDNQGESQIVVNPHQMPGGGGVVPGVNGNLGDIGTLGGSGNEAVKKYAKTSAGSQGGVGGSFSSEQMKTALVNAHTALSGDGGPFSAGREESGGGADGNSMRRAQGSDLVSNPSPGGEGGSSELGFSGDRSLASENSGKEGVDGSRGKNDPEDYFTRIGLNSNIFTIVTTRLRQEQADWILSSHPKPAANRKSASKGD